MARQPRSVQGVRPNSQSASTVDVTAVRYIDDAVFLQTASDVKDELGQAFIANDPNDLHLKLISSDFLTQISGQLDKDRFDYRLETITSVAATGLSEQLVLATDVDMPFEFNTKTSELTVRLQDTNREFSNERVKVFSAIQSMTHRRDTKSATPITSQSPPTITIGKIVPRLLESDYRELVADPTTYLEQFGIYAPETVVLGGLYIAALHKGASDTFSLADYVENFGNKAFDGMRMLGRGRQVYTGGEFSDLIFE